MALVIEDGTGKGDAQTYRTAVQARAYALARGVVLDAGDAPVEAQLVNAMDYLEALRAQYQGSKTWPVASTDPVHVAQALQWPRTGVVIDCEDYPDNAIPAELGNAQMQLVVEQAKGFSLLPSSDGMVVKRKKVDVIEKEFFSANDMGISGNPMPTFPLVDALLAPLFNACGTGAFLTTVRI